VSEEKMLRLPVGIQSFEKIRTDDFYYVDKTRYVEKLFNGGSGYYFLSRPRRFGKSLFLDTLRHAFLGRKELFKGLYIEDKWDWSRHHKVIYISFGAGVIRSSEELIETIFSIIRRHQEEYQVELREKLYNKRLEELIFRLYRDGKQRVAVFIDEYDKPILDNIDQPETATEIREILKYLYSVLKDADQFLKFVFITGVTKFSKVSLFSGLNNLKDLTGALCGYTQNELEKIFADRLKNLHIEEIKKWYNGYSWLGEPAYNPFDILLFLDTKDFRPYWFETGTPTFLMKLLVEKKYFIPDLEKLEVGEELIDSFEIESIRPETLLFQTGYLTIDKTERILGRKRIYRLAYPNLKVKSTFSDYLLTYFVEDIQTKTRNEIRMARILEAGNIEELMDVFHSFFASIPHDWYRKNEISGYERYYASIFYCYFAAIGLDVRVEDATNHGRLDMAVILDSCCYLFEFKTIEIAPEGKAIKQLKGKKYYESSLDSMLKKNGGFSAQ
jgi:hypothetical protein